MLPVSIHNNNSINHTQHNIYRRSSDASLNDICQELIAKLKNIGFNDEESSEIVLQGLVHQHECHLFRLTSHNIFASKICNWQGPLNVASKSIMEFLKQLGFDDNTLKIVAEKGISAEVMEIIKDLGYNEFDQRVNSGSIEVSEAINIVRSFIFKMTFTLQPLCYCTDKMSSKNLNSNSIKSSSYSRSSRDSERNKEFRERKNFIRFVTKIFPITHVILTCNILYVHSRRNNLAAPLTWAMRETLKYNPTDPIHYLACQLLRWKHNNVQPSVMKEVVDFVNNASVSN